MSIVVQCECGKKYKVGDSNAGKRMRCKACSGVIAIPKREPAPADEWDDFGGGFDDFTAGDDFDDFPAESAAPRRQSKSGGGSRKSGKNKKAAKSTDGMAPALRYGLAGGIVVVTIGIVLGILYARGVIGGGKNDDNEKVADEDRKNDDGNNKGLNPVERKLVGSWRQDFEINDEKLNRFVTGILRKQLRRDPTPEEVKRATDKVKLSNKAEIRIIFKADGTLIQSSKAPPRFVEKADQGTWQANATDSDRVTVELSTKTEKDERLDIRMTIRFENDTTFQVLSMLTPFGDDDDFPGTMRYRKE